MAKVQPLKPKAKLNRGGVWVLPMPPKQNCIYCGQLIPMTPISLMRYNEEDGPKEYLKRGFFYQCKCSMHELQPVKPEVWEHFAATAHEPYRVDKEV